MAKRPDIIARVARYMEENHMLPPECAGVLCAVSGGADSMCMLDLLNGILAPRGIKIAAAHFNHNLRGEESLRDELFVSRFCGDSGISFFVGRGDIRELSAREGIGIEEAARNARYQFLGEVSRNNGLSHVATAHSADDNLETVILNLARGTGLRGLSGIPPVRDNIIRPVLILERYEIENYLREKDISYITDSTNLSLEYSRNKIRHSVIPVLREINPSVTENVMRASRILRGDDDYLNSLASDFIESCCSGSGSASGLPVSGLTSLPRAVASRVVRIMSLPRSLGETHVDAVLQLCTGASPSASLDLPDFRVRREYDTIVFDCDKPVIIRLRHIAPGDSFTFFPGGPIITCKFVRVSAGFYNSFNIFYFKPDNICGKISVGSRKPGDTVKLLKRGVTKSLHKLFIEKKIPREKRDLIPVIRDDCGVIAVSGFGVSERVSAEPGDDAIMIEIVEAKI